MRSRISAQKRLLFAQYWQKRRDFWPKNDDFLGFVFTDKYICHVDEYVYYLTLALINTSQKLSFEGGGGGGAAVFFPF
jgi:hypothetical protein